MHTYTAQAGSCWPGIEWLVDFFFTTFLSLGFLLGFKSSEGALFYHFPRFIWELRKKPFYEFQWMIAFIWVKSVTIFSIISMNWFKEDGLLLIAIWQYFSIAFLLCSKRYNENICITFNSTDCSLCICNLYASVLQSWFFNLYRLNLA